MRALNAIRPMGVGSTVKVFGLSESQIARRVKAIARAAGLSDWEFFSGHSGWVGMARRMAQNGAPTHEIAAGLGRGRLRMEYQNGPIGNERYPFQRDRTIFYAKIILCLS